MPFKSQSYWRKTVSDRRFFNAVILAVLIGVGAGCDSKSSAPPPADPEPVSIAVTSYPLLVMTEEMAGDAAEVNLVVSGEHTSPDWKPTSEAIRTMQDSTRILISGGDYEPWLQRVTLPRSRLVDTARGYYGKFVRIPDAVIHQHGPDGSHSHPGVVWATWLDPQLAMSQLDQTRDVLLEVLPDATATIRSAADALSQQFSDLDKRLKEIAAATTVDDITVLGDAPVYQYLAARLGWELHYVHLPVHGPLSQDNRKSVHDAIEQHQPTVIFARSTLADEVNDLAGDREIPIAPIDLCETADADQSLLQRLSGNLDAISRTLAGQ